MAERTRAKKTTGSKKPPLQQWNDNWKAGWQKIGDGFGTLFGLPPRPRPGAATGASGVGDEVYAGDEEETAPGLELTQSHLENDTAWTRFVTGVRTNFETMQGQFEEFNTKMVENVKNNSTRFQESLKKNQQKNQEAWAERKRLWDEQLAQMAEERKQKAEENRQAWAARMEHMQKGWQGFVEGQRRDVEHSIKFLNRLGWRAHLNFLLWIIPVIIVATVIMAIITGIQGIINPVVG
jgi:gas vesicle protein